MGSAPCVAPMLVAARGPPRAVVAWRQWRQLLTRANSHFGRYLQRKIGSRVGRLPSNALENTVSKNVTPADEDRVRLAAKVLCLEGNVDYKQYWSIATGLSSEAAKLIITEHIAKCNRVLAACGGS